MALDRALYYHVDNNNNVDNDNNEDVNNDDESESSALPLPFISPDADSAHVTGFHKAGEMSRYNIQREGIVFSDEDSSCICRNCDFDCRARARDDDDIHNHNNDDDDDDEHKEQHHNCSACRYLSDFSNMFYSLHGIVDYVLFAIERKLELVSEQQQQQQQRSTTQNNQSDDDDDTNNNNDSNQTIGWFQQHLGPTDTSSQWHIKRFVEMEEDNGEEENIINNDNNKSSSLLTEEGERISLPMHTDPSLISVVIHDDSGDSGRNSTLEGGGSGALGLQYYHPRERKWFEPDEHGHGVATIFVGSVLAHLTSGRFPAAKHRVIEKQQQQRQQQQQQQQRMAATLFVRPQPSALLRVPLPSPWLIQQIQKEEDERHDDGENSSSNTSKKKKKPLSKPPITFDAWLKRVAKNYEKQKKKKNKNIQNTKTT